MPTVILVRHGRTSANASGVLAGRTPGVLLDETGHEQAKATAARLAAIPIAGIVSSPLDRCLETTAHLRDALQQQPAPEFDLVDAAITEADYGAWQGGKLADLAKEPLWSRVQGQPSAVVFPGGESMITMQSRAVDAIRRHDAAFAESHGPGAVWVAVSHGDIIKAILADALGMHLDLFQRLGVGPASVSIVHYGADRPSVSTMNSDAGDLGWLAALAPKADATVGGGAGRAG